MSCERLAAVSYFLSVCYDEITNEAVMSSEVLSFKAKVIKEGISTFLAREAFLLIWLRNIDQSMGNERA